MRFTFVPPPMPAIDATIARIPIVRQTLEQIYVFAFDYGVSVGIQAGLTLGVVIGATAAALVSVVLIFSIVRSYHR